VGSGSFTDSLGRNNDVGRDASFGFGAGFGDPDEAVGLEVAIGIISLTDAFGDSGTVGFKLHKVFPQADDLGVAVGWTNPIDWGDASDAEETIYGAVTKQFQLPISGGLPLTATAGIGTGGFRSLGSIRAGGNAPNFFGSVGVRVLQELSFIGTWTGSQLNLGVSAAPFDTIPLTFVVGAGDVTNNRGNGPRFLGSGGFSFTY
jgi:hypothetical protein